MTHLCETPSSVTPQDCARCIAIVARAEQKWSDARG